MLAAAIRSGLLAALGVTALASCVSTVLPPAHADDPVSVYLHSGGRHAGLLLPCADGRVVVYGYGDWGWYALGEDDWWRAPATVLWPNQGALGRRYLDPADLATLEGTAKIVVSREPAARLLERLDAEFARGGEPHYNAALEMWFARYPESFWMFHTCHDATAEWLEDLGCSVSYSPIRTQLRASTTAQDG